MVYNLVIPEKRKDLMRMEILICTVSKSLRTKLNALADNFLCGRKSRYMSLSSNLLTTKEKLKAAVKKHPMAVVILDVQSFDNWQKIAEEIEALSKTVRICLVSDTAEPAITAINSLKTICGYICRNKLSKMFKEVFSRIYGKIRTVCNGITVTYYNSIDKVIPFDEIFYIETVKQTHLCTVVHKNGTDEIRADISKLIKELPFVFQVVRSSTIANMSEVRSFSDCKLVFSNGSSCFCGKKYSSGIIPFMNQAVLQ